MSKNLESNRERKPTALGTNRGSVIRMRPSSEMGAKRWRGSVKATGQPSDTRTGLITDQQEKSDTLKLSALIKQQWRGKSRQQLLKKTIRMRTEKESAKKMEFVEKMAESGDRGEGCLLYTSPSPRDGLLSRMPSSA